VPLVHAGGQHHGVWLCSMPTGINCRSPTFIAQDDPHTGTTAKDSMASELPERQVAGILNGPSTPRDLDPPATAPCRTRFSASNLGPPGGQQGRILQERWALSGQIPGSFLMGMHRLVDQKGVDCLLQVGGSASWPTPTSQIVSWLGTGDRGGLRAGLWQWPPPPPRPFFPFSSPTTDLGWRGDLRRRRRVFH